MFHLYQDIQITNQQRNKNPQVLYVTSVRNKQLIKKKKIKISRKTKSHLSTTKM